MNFDTTKNLFIEGDNLDALKLLQESYVGKVKLIYIDPPYNTGKDFVYRDDFSVSTHDYLTESSQITEAGEKFVSNLNSNGRFHSDWLSMMFPRLKVARSLLAPDGVAVISIDDNEQANIKELCAEVFGPGNFVAQLPTVMNLKGNNDQFGFAGTHEYTLIYARDSSVLTLNQFPLDDDEMGDWEEDERGPFKRGAALKATGGNAPRTKRPNLYFPIYVGPQQQLSLEAVPGWAELLPVTDGAEMSWRWSKQKFLNELDDVIIVPAGSSFTLYKKQRPALGELPSAKPKSTFYKPEYSSGNGTAVVKRLFGGAKVFDNPKPLALLEDLILICTSGDSVVLELFAGSATAAHAVMTLNAADSGKRSFIVIQAPEETSSDSEARRLGYQTIAEVARARIRAAGKETAAQGLLDGNWQDIGFRSLRVDTTNIADVSATADALGQRELVRMVSSVKSDRTDEDLLFQVLIDWGLDLSLKIERGGGVREYFRIADDALIACFSEEVSADVVTEIAKLQPLRAVFRDSAFKSDAVRINAEQLFRELSPGTEVKTI
ncbi:MAG: site-specific DNA-methyltransferase [Cryobacterium sp.]|nr:site-specific DNA-methyltransferase [Cryobacterium sp.]